LSANRRPPLAQLPSRLWWISSPERTSPETWTCVDLVSTRANGQPAFGAYLRAGTGIRHGSGLFVRTLAGDRICAFARFDSSVLPWFGAPRSLPG